MKRDLQGLEQFSDLKVDFWLPKLIVRLGVRDQRGVIKIKIRLLGRRGGGRLTT